MGALGLIVFFVFGSTTSTTTVPEAKGPTRITDATAAGSSIGIPECDEFIARWRCFLGKTGVSTKPADDMEEIWKKSYDNIPESSKKMGLNTLVGACKQSTSDMEAQFSGEGC